MDIQTALITVASCLIRALFGKTRLDQIFGQYYRIRIGLDNKMDILDWIRITKISDPFNSNLNQGLSNFLFLQPILK